MWTSSLNFLSITELCSFFVTFPRSKTPFGVVSFAQMFPPENIPLVIKISVYNVMMCASLSNTSVALSLVNKCALVRDLRASCYG